MEENTPATTQSFAAFWPIYVLAHREPLTRVFHVCGTLLGWALLLSAIVFRLPWLVLATLLAPYALAWFSHFFIGHNDSDNSSVMLSMP